MWISWPYMHSSPWKRVLGCKGGWGVRRGRPGSWQKSVRAWNPSHHPSKGAGQPWGQPGQTSILQHVWGRDWWSRARLDWGSESVGQDVVCGLESPHLGISISYRKDFPKLLRARVMRGKVASEHHILVQAAVTAVTGRLPHPEGYVAVSPHNFFQEQVVVTPLAFHSDPEAPKHFSQH